MIQVEHTPKQKVISLIAFLWMASAAVIVIVGTVQNDLSWFSKLATILSAAFAFLLFAYPCWFTFTYRFQVDDTKIVRKSGFRQTETKWEDIVAWSVKSRPKKNTFNEEPILRDVKGQEISLDAGVWYSSANIAQAREEFLALVQAKLPHKQESSR